jgi:hypothetical protein
VKHLALQHILDEVFLRSASQAERLAFKARARCEGDPVAPPNVPVPPPAPMVGKRIPGPRNH